MNKEWHDVHSERKEETARERDTTDELWLVSMLCFQRVFQDMPVCLSKKKRQMIMEKNNNCATLVNNDSLFSLSNTIHTQCTQTETDTRTM
jgi:hypothetical protein